MVCPLYRDSTVLPFLTFMDCENNLLSCFDIIFVHLGVIARTWYKIVKIEAASGCYFITNRLKKGIKEATVPNIPSHKIN